MSEYPLSSDPDFDAIAGAMQSTRRGRHFLSEFARRERAGLREAMEELERAIAREMERYASAPAAAAEEEHVADTKELTTRVECAVGALDGIVATTTSTVAAALRASRQARLLSERAKAADARLAADLADLAATVEACGLQAQAGDRAREIFDVLDEVHAHLNRRGEKRVAKLPPYLRVVADNGGRML